MVFGSREREFMAYPIGQKPGKGNTGRGIRRKPLGERDIVHRSPLANRRDLLPLSAPMSIAAAPATAISARRTSRFAWISWTIVLSSLAYFVVHNVPRYFVFTQESYGKYFWPRAHWLFPHVASGLLAILIGPMQFWPRMRSRYMNAHRFAGRVYVATVLAGSIAGLGMASTIPHEPAYALGLAFLAVAWFTTTAMAFVAIRRKNILQHRQWMVRSYVVTFAFVIFRLTERVMAANNILPEESRDAVLAWGCWAVPLLVTEVVIQSRAVFSPRAPA